MQVILDHFFSLSLYYYYYFVVVVAVSCLSFVLIIGIVL